jgi:hypothetical protein
MRHFLYVPFQGLGLYGGARGSRWLVNRIQIFKQFVVDSLIRQTSQNFTLWVSWRKEDKGDYKIKALYDELVHIFGKDRVVFTYSGVCFYDDKHEDSVARTRLISALHGAMFDLVNYIGDVQDVLMTIQPSDDCYHTGMVKEMQELFNKTDFQALGYKHGYLANYQTLETREYNPETNPPFYTIKFPKDTFLDPFRHAKYTALKVDAGKYAKGTPLPSHEYVKDCLKYMQIERRGFLVGTHGENISTHFNNPYGGAMAPPEILKEFGLEFVKPIKICYSIRKQIMKKLPYRVQRKFRYIFGEKLYQSFYKFIHG